ncbi:hypothetical protein EJB05_12913, partial [Eragrostis curvula]
TNPTHSKNLQKNPASPPNPPAAPPRPIGSGVLTLAERSSQAATSPVTSQSVVVVGTVPCTFRADTNSTPAAFRRRLPRPAIPPLESYSRWTRHLVFLIVMFKAVDLGLGCDI